MEEKNVKIKKINLKVRFSNPIFLAQLGLAVLMPILAYMGLNVQDLTSWQIVGSTLLNAVKNPYVLGLVVVSVFNSVTDPTTSGIADSIRALEYKKPN